MRNRTIHKQKLAKSIAEAGWNRIAQYTVFMIVDPMHALQNCSVSCDLKYDLNIARGIRDAGL